MRRHIGRTVVVLGLITGAATAFAQLLEQPKLRLDEVVDVAGVKTAVKIPEEWNGSWFLYVHGYAPDPTVIRLDDDRATTDCRTVTIARRLGYATTRSQHPSSIDGASQHTDTVRAYVFERFGGEGKVLIGGNHMGAIICTVMMERYPDRYDGALPLTGVGMPQHFLALERNFHIRVVFDAMFPGLPGDVYDNSEYDSWGPEDALELLERADPKRIEAFLRMWDFPSREEAARWVRMTAMLRSLASPDSRPYDNTNTFYVGSDDDLELNRRVKRYRSNVTRSAEYGEWNLLTGRIKAPVLAVNPTYDFFIPIRSRQQYDELTQVAGTHHLYVQKWLDWPDQLLPTEVIEKAFGELHRWVTEGTRPEPGEINFDREAVTVRPLGSGVWFRSAPQAGGASS